MRKAILLTSLVAGLLDGLAALVMNLKVGAVRIFQFIASGLFGKQAFGGGWWMVALGMLIHFFIAFIWVWLFFACCKALKLYGPKLVFLGTFYGIVVWVIMNLAVLPLSKIPSTPFNWLSAVNGAVILMLAVGLPAGVGAYRYFPKK
ncbi:MAG: hypothetical protein INR69_23130 [Mucilaginibacter polytrichastri]|nr:hypothetical protein [Mucilaginibacter polytrichastri]